MATGGKEIYIFTFDRNVCMRVCLFQHASFRFDVSSVDVSERVSGVARCVLTVVVVVVAVSASEEMSLHFLFI